MALLGVGCCWIPSANAESAEGPVWRTGPALRQALEQPVTINWQGVSLRAAVARLSETQQVALLLDRRVDPDQMIEFQAHGVPLRETCATLAAERGQGFTLLDSVGFIGPSTTAANLRTWSAVTREEVSKLPMTRRAALLRVAAWRWPDLSTPRELLDELAREAGVTLRGTERIPHDLWAGADLPPLAWTDRLLLVSLQWDLLPRWSSDGGSLELIPAPAEARLVRSYPAGPNPTATRDRFRQRAPAADVTLSGNQVIVRGRLEDHEQLTAPASVAVRPAPRQLEDERYTLTIQETPLEPLLRTLEQRLGLTIRYDRAALERAGVRLDQRVSFQVQQATLDQLLSAVLQPAKLTFRRQGTMVELVPPAPNGGQ